MYMLFILVSEIFPNNISLDVDKCKGKKMTFSVWRKPLKCVTILAVSVLKTDTFQ